MRAPWMLALLGCSFEPSTVATTPGDGPETPDGVTSIDGVPAIDGVFDVIVPPGDAAPLGPWTMIKSLDALNDADASDDDPTLSADLRELYFASARNGAEDLFVSRRATPDDDWGAPSPVTELNTTGEDTDPELSRDGLTLYFSSDRDGNMDIFVATRAGPSSPWQDPTRIPALSSASSDYPSSQDAAETHILIQSARSGTVGMADLWEATWTGSAWGTPTGVDELNTSDEDRTAWLSADGLTLMFASSRPGGAGVSDLYLTTRASLTAPYAEPERIVELASTADDADPSVSADLRYMVFMSTRGGNQDLYEARR